MGERNPTQTYDVANLSGELETLKSKEYKRINPNLHNLKAYQAQQANMKKDLARVGELEKEISTNTTENQRVAQGSRSKTLLTGAAGLEDDPNSISKRTLMGY